MKRREFITALGSAVAWPLAVHAQQPIRRVAVLMATGDTDPEGRARLQAFLQGFQELSWVEGRNVKIEVRWADGNLEQTRSIAAELVSLAPDVLVVNGTPGLAAIKRATSSISIADWNF
jgi:putative ABC transport system substrate-binding protein